MLRAEYPTLVVGTYYIRVGAASEDENNYSLDVSVTAP